MCTLQGQSYPSSYMTFSTYALPPSAHKSQSQLLTLFFAPSDKRFPIHHVKHIPTHNPMPKPRLRLDRIHGHKILVQTRKPLRPKDLSRLLIRRRSPALLSITIILHQNHLQSRAAGQCGDNYAASHWCV